MAKEYSYSFLRNPVELSNFNLSTSLLPRLINPFSFVTQNGKKKDYWYFFLSNPVKFPRQPSLSTPYSLSIIPTKLASLPSSWNCRGYVCSLHLPQDFSSIDNLWVFWVFFLFFFWLNQSLKWMSRCHLQTNKINQVLNLNARFNFNCYITKIEWNVKISLGKKWNF